jgi:hypothetical protein
LLWPRHQSFPTLPKPNLSPHRRQARRDVSRDVWFEPSAVNIGVYGGSTGVTYGEKAEWSDGMFGERAAISEETFVEGCEPVRLTRPRS